MRNKSVSISLTEEEYNDWKSIVEFTQYSSLSAYVRDAICKVNEVIRAGGGKQIVFRVEDYDGSTDQDEGKVVVTM